MDSIAKTVQGEVRGTLTDGIASFKGIPYAAPPFGPNRFRAPARPAAWDGIRDATAFGPTAPHGPYSAPLNALVPEPIIAGDDCLNLNVWSPDVGAASLPVMVWIHGGSFLNGSGAVPTYDGHNFARDGVVCVTINYRLGADGFLVLDGVPANRGLLDQVAALEWVQENISAFGGDPRNVAVFGESAGAIGVTALLSMPRAAGLFRRAVAQSGGGHHALAPETAHRVMNELARQFGVPPTRAAIASIPVGLLVDAQQQLALEIAADPDQTGWDEIALDQMAFKPVVDGTVLPQRPIDAIVAGAGSDVDLLVGTTHDEFGLFLVPDGLLDFVDENVLGASAGSVGLDDSGVTAYRGDARSPGGTMSAIMTDYHFRIPAIRLAEGHGGRSHLYEFAWRSPLFEGRLGACHALELPFVFDTLEVDDVGALYAGAPQSVATVMHKAWVDFATSGDPGWPAYDATTRATMTFDLDSRVVNDPRPKQRALWDGIR